MKKPITLITALMIFTAASVYACDEGSTNSGKADVSKAAKTTTAASVKQVNAKTAEVTVKSTNVYKSCSVTGNVKSTSAKIDNAKVKDVSDSEVRRFEGTDQDIIQVWDGRDTDGVVVSEGVHTYYLEALHPDTQEVILEGSGEIEVDNTPPTANITQH